MSFAANVQNWNDCVWTDVREKMRVLAYQGENLTATLTEVSAGHTPGPHRHIYEQLVLILQGECDFFIDGTPYHLMPGCLVDIPANIEHYIVAKGEVPVLNLDVFAPRRPEREESRRAQTPRERAAIPRFEEQNAEM